MNLWASTPEAFLLALYGRRVWHDLECGGYLPTSPEGLRPLLRRLSSDRPSQLVFWVSSSDSTLLSSYPDPEVALQSARFWAGPDSDLQVAPAALLAVLN